MAPKLRVVFKIIPSSRGHKCCCLALLECYGGDVAGPGKDDSYADKRDDYQKNEVAVDYNSGFTGAHRQVNSPDLLALNMHVLL